VVQARAWLPVQLLERVPAVPVQVPLLEPGLELV
jgi:hypothetical protein